MKIFFLRFNINMLNISLDELRLIPQNRNIRDYVNKSEKDLIKAPTSEIEEAGGSKSFMEILILLIMMILIIMIMIMILPMMMNTEKLEALEDYLRGLIEIITNQ